MLFVQIVLTENILEKYFISLINRKSVAIATNSWLGILLSVHTEITYRQRAAPEFLGLTNSF